VIGAVVIRLRDPINGELILMLVACSMPSFAGGLAEDITKRVPPRWRLLFMAASCILAFRFVGLMIPRLDIEWLDPLLTTPYLALPLTVFAMLTITNAVNLIDGMNGLAGVVAAVMFAGLAYVAFKVGDTVVLSSSLLMAGSIVGFLFWNYPNGHIFLGDGGAYFIGFVLGALAIMLVDRHAEVSAFFPPLLLAYPLVEVAFSIYRRRILKGSPAGLPDAAHLHQLIYKRVVRWAAGTSEPNHKTRRNAMTAPYLWVLSSLAVAPAVGFYDNRIALAAFFFVFVASYVWIYWRIVRMKVPRWMITGKRKPAPD
jgi:UDP-N-acetylmuramyl pentapeptide phosphotransferase/UDP-N-acetylglucosamine-1-phosphate transferase